MNEKIKFVFDRITSPKAFTTYAVIGVGVTVVMAILDTRKQCKYENEKKTQRENSDEPMTREEVKEEVQTTIKNYAPTAVSTLATIFCINKAESKWIDYNGMLSAGMTATQDKLNRFRSAAPGLVAAELVSGFGHQKAEEGKQWFCIKGFGTEPDVYFQSTIGDVIYAEYCLNRNFQYRGSASVREFFAFLDILDQCTMKHEMLGWDVGTMIEDWGLEFPWIDFEHYHTTDPETGEEITVIDYIWNPYFSADDTPFSNPWEYMPASYNYPHE